MKPLHHIKRVTTLLLLLIFPVMLQAQEEYMMELGVGGGGSFYMGDANTTRFFRNTESAFGVLWRYNFNPRYSLKVDATRAKVSGDTKTSGNAFPLGQEVSFGKDIYNVEGSLNLTSMVMAIICETASGFLPIFLQGWA